MEIRLLERENIAKEVDMDSREVVEVIVKEVDDERRRKQQQQKIAAAEQAQRSTGAVDRPHKQVIGRPARSTDVHNVHMERARSTARSTD